MGILEHRASGRRELAAAVLFLAQVEPFAAVLRSRFTLNLDDFVIAAHWTADSFRPAHLLKEIQALIFGTERLGYVYQGSWLSHKNVMPETLVCV